MKRMAKRLILGSPLETAARWILNKPPKKPEKGGVLRPTNGFQDSASYWETRYRKKGNSGAGSYGRLAEFKAEILNDFVAKNGVKTVLEFGCGDGNQLTLANYPSYIGFDISRESIKMCKTRFKEHESKQFYHVDDFSSQRADLSLSLDVIYHLVEDEIFEKYMLNLVKSSKRFIIVYASNHDTQNEVQYQHVRHRKFTNWFAANAPQFKQVSHIKNAYPFDLSDTKNTSFADFYIFEKG